MSFIFDKFAPPPEIYGSKDALYHFSVHSSAKKTISEVLKIGIFRILHFGRQANGEAIAPPPPCLRYCASTILLGLSGNSCHKHNSDEILSFKLPTGTKHIIIIYFGQMINMRNLYIKAGLHEFCTNLEKEQAFRLQKIII